MKTVLLPLALILSTSLMAQEKKIKVCIKIDENKNGVISKVDTCYESTNHADVEAFLERMGVENHMNIQPGGSSESKTVIIKHTEENEGDEEGNFMSSGPGSIVIEMDENGNVKSSEHGTKVIVKEFSGDEKELEKEIEKLIKEAESMKDNAGQEGNMVHKEIRILLAKKIEFSQLSDEDKKSIPKNLKKVKGNTFDELSLSPNPAKDIVTISYKNNTADVLKINLYDASGKLILSEEEGNSSREMNKHLDLSMLEKGVYFMHLEQGKKSEVKKLLVTE